MHVESDYDGLRIAAREFFEEEWAFKKVDALRANVRNREELIRKTLPKRSVTKGYYLWVEYLLWLAGVHEIARFQDLSASEAEGLKLVARARNEFYRHHPPCPKCGATTDGFGQIRCMECKAELK